LVCGWKMKMI